MTKESNVSSLDNRLRAVTPTFSGIIHENVSLITVVFATVLYDESLKASSHTVSLDRADLPMMLGLNKVEEAI
jgi:hypothetical protein